MTDEDGQGVSPRNLLITAWLGGLVTLGGAVAAIVLVPGASSALLGEPSLPFLVVALIALILVLSASGWFLGARLGEVGTLLFIMISTTMWAFALKETDSLKTALLGATVTVGPFFTGWVLGLLAASRRQGAEDQNKVSAWLYWSWTDLGRHGVTARKLLFAAWFGGLVTLGSTVAALVRVAGAPSPLPGEPGLPSFVGALVALIVILSGMGWFIGTRLGPLGALPFIMISMGLGTLALESNSLETALMAYLVALGPFLTGWVLGILAALCRSGAASQG